jgi:hypothetical protein
VGLLFSEELVVQASGLTAKVSAARKEVKTGQDIHGLKGGILYVCCTLWAHIFICFICFFSFSLLLLSTRYYCSFSCPMGFHDEWTIGMRAKGDGVGD